MSVLTRLPRVGTAVKAGFEVRVLTDLAAGVNPDGTEAALREMADEGVELLRSSQDKEGP